MKKKILYLISLVKIIFRAKIIWKSPEKKRLIIFDNYTTRYLSKKIFKRDEIIEILCPGEGRSLENIYVSFEVITKSIIEILKGNFTNFYYIALIKIIEPKVILTFTEYNFAFFKIAKKLRKKYKFIIIQMSHSSLFEYSEKDLKKFYTPEFLCLNKFTVDHYSSLGVKVEKFTVIGSINLSLAEQSLNLNQNNQKLNNPYICVIAGAMPYISQSLDNKVLKQLYERQVKLWQYVDRFSRKHKIFFKLASRQEEDYEKSDLIKHQKYERENQIFNEISKNNSFFTKEKRFKEKFSNYELAFNSELVIGFHSTLLLESLAKQKKILCLSSLDHYKSFPLDPLMPEDNVSSMYNPSYEDFENRILKLYNMPLEKYLEIIFYKKKYMLYYDSKYSTIKRVQDHINKIV
tara:strand:+ start:1211 stop:2425 length:1215 start_codon:yes stop_codon:yes gene_type:complete